MTEGEFLAATDPTPMLAFLRGRASDRKLRLFACACARRVWERLDASGRWAVEAAERFADGAAAGEELGAAHAAAHEAALAAVSGWGANRRHDHARFAAASCAAPNALVAARTASQDLLRRADEGLLRPAEQAVQVGDIRCVVGNPCRPAAFSPEWRTDTARALAQQAYEAREFGTLPILADALQDAGCDTDEILDHCRCECPHVRGCWVVDQLLARQ